MLNGLFTTSIQRGTVYSPIRAMVTVLRMKWQKNRIE